MIDNMMPAAMVDAAKFEQLDDGRTLVSIEGGAFCQIDTRTIAVGSPDTLRQVLQRNSKAMLAPELQESFNAADFSQVLTIVAAMPTATAGEARSGIAAIEEVVVNVDADSDLHLAATLVMETEGAAAEISKYLNIAPLLFQDRFSPETAAKALVHSTSGKPLQSL